MPSFAFERFDSFYQFEFNIETGCSLNIVQQKRRWSSGLRVLVSFVMCVFLNQKF